MSESIKFTRKVTVTEFRRDMRVFINEVVYQKRRMILGSFKDRCAIIPYEDLQKLEKYELEEARK